MLSPTKNARKPHKRAGSSLKRRLLTKNLLKGAMDVCSRGFLNERQVFIDALRDQIQFSSEFDYTMHWKIREILRCIMFAYGSNSPVHNSDEFESSSTSSDSGRPSSSSSEETPDRQRYNDYQEGESFRVNFAFHVERFLKRKFMPLSESQSCQFAARLAEATKMSSEDIKKMKLEDMLVYINHVL